MLSIFNQYTDGVYSVTEYTRDGATISHIIKTIIQTEPSEPQEPEPTMKEIQETQMAIMSGIFDIYMAQLGM